jgi:hypothetical protein
VSCFVRWDEASGHLRHLKFLQLSKASIASALQALEEAFPSVLRSAARVVEGPRAGEEWDCLWRARRAAIRFRNPSHRGPSAEHTILWLSHALARARESAPPRSRDQ